MIDLILIGLAAWRIASFFVNEDGPFDLFARLRRASGIRDVPVRVESQIVVGKVVRYQLSKVLTCVWCMSVWTSLAAYLISLIPVIGQPIVLILAGSSIAIIFGEVIQWLDSRR